MGVLGTVESDRSSPESAAVAARAGERERRAGESERGGAWGSVARGRCSPELAGMGGGGSEEIMGRGAGVGWTEGWG